MVAGASLAKKSLLKSLILLRSSAHSSREGRSKDKSFPHKIIESRINLSN